jgi:hypothetical protein
MSGPENSGNAPPVPPMILSSSVKNDCWSSIPSTGGKRAARDEGLGRPLRARLRPGHFQPFGYRDGSAIHESASRITFSSAADRHYARKGGRRLSRPPERTSRKEGARSSGKADELKGSIQMSSVQLGADSLRVPSLLRGRGEQRRGCGASCSALPRGDEATSAVRATRTIALRPGDDGPNPQARSTTSPISTLSIVMASPPGGLALSISAAACADSSDSNVSIDVPVFSSSLTHWAETKPGACLIRGIPSCLRKVVACSKSWSVLLTTNACIAASPFSKWVRLTLSHSLTAVKPRAPT